MSLASSEGVYMSCTAAFVLPIRQAIMIKIEVTPPELAGSEKTREPSASSLDLGDKDEALRLVGLERAEIFTKEEYLKVRRKLVSPSC